MITKDIRLEDCILDLLDNSLDAARRNGPKSGSLAGFKIALTLSSSEFAIVDNCGGIPRTEALNYAFNFGHSRGSDHLILDHGIGRYGIGMKRAVFKLGDEVRIESEHANKRFVVAFRVSDWEVAPSWDFPLVDAAATKREGTVVRVTNLHAGVGESLAEITFQHALERTISRDYVRFLEKGVVVTLNGKRVGASTFRLLSGDKIKPALVRQKLGRVSISVRAGLIRRPSDPDDSLNRATPEDSGWYVLCNDRVVLAADKTDRTGWGVAGVPNWHPQYNGFLGWVAIDADDPSVLPWSTTKRELDPQNQAYRVALKEMRRLAKQFTTYTNDRKKNPEAAVKAEHDLRFVELEKVRANDSLTFPKLGKAPARWKTIKYSVDVDDYREALELLDEGELEPNALGLRLFEMFLEDSRD